MCLNPVCPAQHSANGGRDKIIREILEDVSPSELLNQPSSITKARELQDAMKRELYELETNKHFGEKMTGKLNKLSTNVRREEFGTNPGGPLKDIRGNCREVAEGIAVVSYVRRAGVKWQRA
jgi:hypothetical protein